MNISDDDIEELQKLKDKGIISVEEFVSKLKIFTRKNNSVADNVPSAPMYLPPSANFRNSATITENDIKILSKLKDKKIISAEEFQAKFDKFSRQNKPVVKDTAKRPPECPISSVYESDITPPLKETIPFVASCKDIIKTTTEEVKTTNQKTITATKSDTEFDDFSKPNESIAENAQSCTSPAKMSADSIDDMPLKNSVPPSANKSDANTISTEYIEKLSKFKARGIITAEEFHAELNKFLMQQNTPPPYYTPPQISEPNNIPYYAQIPTAPATPNSGGQSSFVGILVWVVIVAAIAYFWITSTFPKYIACKDGVSEKVCSCVKYGISRKIPFMDKAKIMLLGAGEDELNAYDEGVSVGCLFKEGLNNLFDK